MRVTAIVLAAGKGERFKSRIPKPLVKIDSQPLIIKSLNLLSQCPFLHELIIVVNAQNQAEIASVIRRFSIPRVRSLVRGGKRRQDSVRNALRMVSHHSDVVLIHDAARPFIDRKILERVLRQVKKSNAAIAGVPVKATVKRVSADGVVRETLPREQLWEIQTPQAFKKDLLLRAYRAHGNDEVTDDAMLVEKLGVKVSVVMGAYKNIKITTPEDLIIAQSIAESR
ncbi:MAG: 2-C-methyl-D-erythritol 4-phosphate cytidylyltransferase [Candidatus Omnitrophica bacterium]|nr:2-C-methyl-D-erythritol 4-phosphate cytidylyltransferase [Candidatus Omnitrophota bacterium]